MYRSLCYRMTLRALLYYILDISVLLLQRQTCLCVRNAFASTFYSDMKCLVTEQVGEDIISKRAWVALYPTALALVSLLCSARVNKFRLIGCLIGGPRKNGA